MLLNLVCNDNMNFNDGTCCKSSDRPTSLQAIILYWERIQKTIKVDRLDKGAMTPKSLANVLLLKNKFV